MACHQPANHKPDAIPVLRIDQLPQGQPHRFFSGISDRLLCQAIERGDAHFEVKRVNLVAGVFEQVAISLLTAFERLLGLLAQRDVFDLSNVMRSSAKVVLHDRDLHPRPNDASLLVHVAFFDLDGCDAVAAKLRGYLARTFEIVGMRDLLPRPGQQLFRRVAQHPAQCCVGMQEAAL